MQNYPYVVTISSEKGGVGKTTLATNLAIFLKAINEDLPVSIFSFDNHFTVDKMFEIKGQKIKGNVADLLLEKPGSELLHTGQYGVNYIPSSTALADLKHSIKMPMLLARLLALSQMPGILIIDTRPDLDVLTENALYAADRVIIPVKDMASLENCRNIFELFDKRGLDKKSLALIPCLIDSRIKYEGMFRDQRTLLKSYAINRGYRCLDVHISKSPKVESLNTNPAGRVYPILTYARGTEVHGQFFKLASLVMDEMGKTAEPRSLLFQQWLTAENGRKKEAFFARLTGLKPDCLFCKRPLLKEPTGTVSYYFETSDGSASGFLEDECFFGFLLSSIYNLDKRLTADDPTWHILKDSTKESSFAFRPVQNGNGAEVEFSQFDLKGARQLKKRYQLKEYEGGLLSKERSKLFSLMSETMAGYGESLRDGFLYVHPVNSQEPEAVLLEENYRAFNRLKKRIGEQIGEG